MPDMCAGLQSDDGLTSKKRYIAWADEFLTPQYGGFLTGTDCYGLRCAFLHQGRMEPHVGSYSRVLFVEPGASSNVFHMNVMNDALNIDVRLFVIEMITAARAWLDKAKGSSEYSKNIEQFMTRYPDGIAPYIVGVPVIS